MFSLSWWGNLLGCLVFLGRATWCKCIYFGCFFLLFEHFNRKMLTI